MGSSNMSTWIEHLSALDKSKFQIILSTTAKYAQIKSLSLETVKWEEYSPEELLKNLKTNVKKFIDANAPCLFIFDPKSPDAQKGFLFNVNSVNEIIDWVKKNKNNVKYYNYLITTQITNRGNGFVGSVHSDGKGNLTCETLHYPGICNQRELSQPSKNYSEFLSELFIEETEDGEIWAISSNHLLKEDIIAIKKEYMQRVGYFEFVKGWQNGKKRIYTIGYETGGLFLFNKDIHLRGCTNLSYRIRGAALKESN
jgi:hypothetical protein